MAATQHMTKEKAISTVRSLFSTLSPKKQQILEMRYGLLDGKTKTLEEVGRAFNVTRERVRQIEAGALEILKTDNNVEVFNKIIKEYTQTYASEN